LAGSRGPAKEFEGVGEDAGFEDVLDVEGDGDVSKSTQEELEDALADANFYGIDGVEKAEDGEKVRLSLTQAEIEEAMKSPEERQEDLLRAILGELHRQGREAEFGGSGGGSGVSKSENAVELLETIEDELERQEPGEDGEGEGQAEEPTGLTEEQAQVLEVAANLYVEADESHSVDDPLTDILAWMRDQAGDLDGQARGQVYAALASIENTEMEQSETLV
jgi:hypothetical protein